ncbi:MAG: purine-nucleoside phosphorylase [Kiritimatiellia bacterium]|jgi:inosine/guanosine/xanthosine phosphorylase family protein
MDIFAEQVRRAETYREAIEALPPEFREAPPAAALVLGSGWSEALERPGDRLLARVPYSAVPGLGASTVAGHAGELRLFERHGLRAMAFQGRRHRYEGEGWTPVLAPVEIARRLGAPSLLLTNAAGGIREDLSPGRLMALRDHINLTGLNPLQGPVVPGWGPRFPDMSEVYDPAFRAAMRERLRSEGVELSEGVYVYVAGPSFETPAEIRAFRRLDGDAVGMSTVPEAIVAHAIGMRVAAVSCITNFAAGLGGCRLGHEDVLETSRDSLPRMGAVLDAFLRTVAEKTCPAAEDGVP